MDRHTLWQQTMQEYQAEGVQLISLEDLEAETILHTLADGTPPAPIETFLRLWRQDASNPWQTLVQSAASINPQVAAELIPERLLEPLRLLLARVEYGAILCRPPNKWYPSHQWSYLLQIGSPISGAESGCIELYAPASPEDIRAAEAILRFTLPPGYRRFLLIANGLSTGTDETPWIFGAGPQRANWKAVMFNDWFGCENSPEIAAQWRFFQGIYDYERIRDWENGEHAFLSDETILVPFAHTYEAWGFDRTRPGSNGEYPVLFWDHETRQASDYYADFASWFAGEIEPYLFSLD